MPISRSIASVDFPLYNTSVSIVGEWIQHTDEVAMAVCSEAVADARHMTCMAPRSDIESLWQRPQTTQTLV